MPKKLLAAALLGVAAWMAYTRYGYLIEPVLNPVPAVAIPPDHQAIAQPVRDLVAAHPQKQELFAFYMALAETVPRLPDTATGKQVRDWFENAAKLMFGDTFQKVPGLAERIHGQNGVIAQIYGLEPGKLDKPKMQSALKAVAWACR